MFPPLQKTFWTVFKDYATYIPALILEQGEASNTFLYIECYNTTVGPWKER